MSKVVIGSAKKASLLDKAPKLGENIYIVEEINMETNLGIKIYDTKRIPVEGVNIIKGDPEKVLINKDEENECKVNLNPKDEVPVIGKPIRNMEAARELVIRENEDSIKRATKMYEEAKKASDQLIAINNYFKSADDLGYNEPGQDITTIIKL